MSLTRHSVREQIRDALMARILDGSYAPGQRLVELQLAGEFESSQAPVREALRAHTLYKRDVHYIVCCDTGRRSSAGAYILSERGFRASVLRGGLMAYQDK